MTVQPYPLRLTEQPGAAGSSRSLIRRVLRKPVPNATGSRCVSILGHAGQSVTNGSFAGRQLTQMTERHRSWLAGGADLTHLTSFVDSGEGTAVLMGDSRLICHVLWCADERSAHVLAGIDPAASIGSVTDPERLIRRPISPGDTIVIPAGMPHAFGPGILAFHLRVEAGPDQAAHEAVPTHGLSRFQGFNRRTICAAGKGYALERWKTTQPLRLEREDERWMFVTNLVGPVAIVWNGGSEPIAGGESRLLPASLRSLTLVPDGIAYVLCAYAPDLMQDIVAPLRLAGYRNDEIATVMSIDRASGPCVRVFGSDGRPPAACREPAAR